MIPLKEKISIAEERTNTNPTEGQKVGGNYQKGKVIIKGLKVSIENPVGTKRSGINKKGEYWETIMPFSYGYFNGTVGKDGDPLDVYLGPIVDQDFDVYIIDQVDEETRSFDEHKIMFGFESPELAHRAYLMAFKEDWTGFGCISTFSLLKFKTWIKNKDAIKYPANRTSMSKKMDFKNVAEDDRIKIVNLYGEILEDVSLGKFKKDIGDIDSFDILAINIASPGGSVSEGLMIMVWMDYLSSIGKEIVTIVNGNAYSIASLIMLAADVRIISVHGKVMVHNPMVPKLEYANATELEEYALELRDLESTMYELYMIFTGLSQEQIKALMDNETYLSPEEAVNNGFADLVMNIKPKPYEMAVNNKKEINMSNTLNILKKVLAKVNKSEFVNQLYYGNGGEEIEIFQNDPSTYSVGDRTDLQKGEVKLADGSVLTIDEFVITEIEKGTEVEPLVEPVVPVAPVEPGAEFNEGPAPVVDPLTEVVKEGLEIEIEEGEEKEITEEMAAESAPVIPAVPVEPNKQKGDMPSTVIETTESVKTTKETVALEAEKEVQAKAPVAFEGPAPADMLAVINELKGVVENLVAKVDNLSKDNVAKFKDLSDFEQVATEAIEALAMSTASNFQPVARASASESKPKGSIFQNMKQKRGL